MAHCNQIDKEQSTLKRLARGNRIRWGLCLCLLALVSARASDTAGSQIWFVNNFSEIRTINPTTLGQRVIIPQKGDAFLERPDLSPNGGKIAYVGPGDGSAIWLANSDGSNDRRISESFASASLLWLNDNSLVIMGTNVSYQRPDEGQIALYDLSTRMMRPLVIPEFLSLCGSPIRPDRVTSWSERYPALGRLEVRNGALVEIPDVTISVPESSRWRFGRACLSWSTDGNKIVIPGRDRSDNDDLFATTDGGRTVTRLTGFAKSYGQASIWAFDISPDGKWTIFDVFLDRPVDPNLISGNYVALVSTDGAQPEFLMETLMVGYLAWSPDSQYVAAALVPRGSDPDYSPKELHVINVETKEIKQLIFGEGQQEEFDWR